MELYDIDNDVVRNEVQQKLDVLSALRKMPDDGDAKNGGITCAFWVNGCIRKFATVEQQLHHIRNCVFGIMQYCDSCPAPNQVFHSTGEFTKHALQHHNGNQSFGTQSIKLPVNLNTGLCDPAPNGYNLLVCDQIQLQIDGQTVAASLGLVSQDVGLDNHKRVMLVPIVYSPDGRVVQDLVQMTATVTTLDGTPILPLGYPGFDVVPLQHSTTSYAFNSTKQFVEAMDHLDKVVSYSHMDLMAHQGWIMLDVSFNVYRCNTGSKLPTVEVALTWKDLALDNNVRATMWDADRQVPSEMAAILIPQFRLEKDFMIEAIDADEVMEVVQTGIIDGIAKMGPYEHRNPLAVIVYPTVTIMKRYVNDWKTRAAAVNLKVFAFTNLHDSFVDFFKRYDWEIVLLTSTILYDLIWKGDLITRDIKYVYFHHHHKNAFATPQANISYCMQQIPIEEAGTLRIAFMERITKRVINFSRPRYAQGDNKKYESTGMFDSSWIQFALGPNPRHQMHLLMEEHVPCKSTNDWIDYILDRILEGGNLRWLILGMMDDSKAILDLKMKLDTSIFSAKRVTWTTKESEIMSNENFWDPFLQRQDSILVGPYFILDHDECHACDAIILLTYPILDADRVRLSLVTFPYNGGYRKPVYACPDLRCA